VLEQLRFHPVPARDAGEDGGDGIEVGSEGHGGMVGGRKAGVKGGVSGRGCGAGSGACSPSCCSYRKTGCGAPHPPNRNLGRSPIRPCPLPQAWTVGPRSVSRYAHQRSSHAMSPDAAATTNRVMRSASVPPAWRKRKCGRGRGRSGLL
jgi:hypothetical protein